MAIFIKYSLNSITRRIIKPGIVHLTMEQLLNKIFLIKNWQFFLGAIAFYVLQGIASDISDLLDTVLYLVGITLYVGWILFLGSWLRRISPTPLLNYPVFIVVGCTLIVFTITFRFIVFFKPEVLRMVDNPIVLIPLMIYFLFSVIILTGFVAKNLKAIECGNDIDINDYFGDVVGLIFWPIGIWFLQPRINKLALRLAS